MFDAYPIVSPDFGLKLDEPVQFLRDEFSPDSENVWIKDGRVKTRRGLTKEVSTLLSGSILHQFEYVKFNGTKHYLLFTRKDIYDYSPSSGSLAFINALYNTGTIAVTNGSATVTGTGTTWSSNLKAGDYITIGAYAVASTWYEIQSVDSDTQITLASNYAESTDSGISYNARKVFVTGTTETWRAQQFVDGTHGDIVVMTNNSESPYYWTGSSYVVEISAVDKAKDIQVMDDRVFFFYIEAGGSAQTQRYIWSDKADVTTYDANNFKDIVETKGKIMSTIRMGETIVCYKDDSKWFIEKVEDLDILYNHRYINAFGCLAIHSPVEGENGDVYYYSSDTRFRVFNGSNDQDISGPVWNFINQINPNKWGHIYGRYVEWDKQVRWQVPMNDSATNDHVMVFQIGEGVWDKWPYAGTQKLRSMGVFRNESDYYVDEDPWQNRYVDEWDGYWDSREFLEDAPIIVYGGDDGYFRRADTGNDDDGDVYTPFYTTKRIDMNKPLHEKRVAFVDAWFLSESGKTVNLCWKIDYKLDFGADTEVLDISDVSKTLVQAKTDIINEVSDGFEFKIHAVPH